MNKNKNMFKILFIISLLYSCVNGFYSKDCKTFISYGKGYEEVTEKKIIEANKSDSLLIMFKTEISDYYACKRNDDIMKYANELLKMESYCGYKRWTYGNFVSDTYVSNFRYINQMITLSREKNLEFC